MTDHPITPPPELVQQWEADATISREAASSWTAAFATRAAQWGADQELEACCAWLEDWVGNDSYAIPMRAARRPKPPSLKERALQAWAAVEAGTDDQTAMAVIRRALEALDG